MDLSSVEFLNKSIGMLSFPFDLPAGMLFMMSSNSSRVKGFDRASFSSVVNFGRLSLER